MNTEMKETDSDQSNHADQPVDTLKADQLTDLPVTTEQETQVAGGRHVNVFRGTTDFILNHNETTTEDDVTEAESLTDLPLTAAQADATKAGSRRDINDIFVFRSPTNP